MPNVFKVNNKDTKMMLTEVVPVSLLLKFGRTQFFILVSLFLSLTMYSTGRLLCESEISFENN